MSITIIIIIRVTLIHMLMNAPLSIVVQHHTRLRQLGVLRVYDTNVMYMYVCIYAYIYIYMYIHTYIHIHIYIYMYRERERYIHTHTYIHQSMGMYRYMNMYDETCSNIITYHNIIQCNMITYNTLRYDIL